MFKATKSVQVMDVFEFLSSTAQVRSSLGAQLEKVRDGTTGTTVYGDGVNEGAIVNRAAVLRCVESLGMQARVTWALCDVLPAFARRVGQRPGQVALGAVRAYEPWCPLPFGSVGTPNRQGHTRGLFAVHEYMRLLVPSMAPYEKDPKAAEVRAGKLLADAKIVIAGYVDLWNRQGGFKSWMGVAEFAFRYGIPERTVQLWCKEGKLPAVLVHDKYRIDVSEVQEPEAEAPLQGGRQVPRAPTLEERDTPEGGYKDGMRGD